MKILLLGARGHASDVLGALEALADTLASDPSEHFSVIGYVADGEYDPARFEGRGVAYLGRMDQIDRVGATHFVACAGYPQGRKKVALMGEAAGLKPFTVIHPRAWLPRTVLVGEGSVVLANACVGPMGRIGRHVLIGQGAVIGHDARVGDFTSIMPAACVSGDVTIGSECLIGTNATIIEKLSIGEGASVGAGSVVTRSVPPGAVAKGVPARF